MEQQEQQQLKQKKSGGRGVILILSVLVVALAVGLAWVYASFQSYKEDAVATLANTQTEYEEQISRMIPVDTLKEYAQQYNVNTEFVQRFFNDTIVYKGSEGFVYAPVEEGYPKNDYQRSNFVWEDGKINYLADGEPQALMGIDVSKHQGEIDWGKVKAAGVDYAMIRVAYRGYGTGKLMLDENFEANITGALEAGIPVGVYLYSQAVNQEEVLEEARFVLDTIREYDVTWPVVFDMEEVIAENVRTANLSTEEITDMTIAFCDAIEEGGYHPVIYGNLKWFLEKLDFSRVLDYDKWLAQYYRAPFFPYEYQMWQYTGGGTLDGIKGNVDLNISFVDYGAAS